MTDRTTNVVNLDVSDGRHESWTLPDGTVVSISVPADQPPLTPQRAIYVFSALIYGFHKALCHD